TGEILAPVGSLSHDDAVAAFREQIVGLMDGGVDVIWAETISSEEEFRAVAEAAERENAPFCGTLSFDTAGRTMMGITSHSFAGIASGLSNPPVAFGANCGTGAPDLLRTVLGVSEAAPDAIVIAKANAGIPKYVDGRIEYDGTPELMARYACLARDAGARLIGGCCGTKPEHLIAMRAALEGHLPGERPSLELIKQDIGAFSSEGDGTGEGQEAPRTRNRRGRRRG
ncbi:MAG: homocysteine S-methyltransferase family protein, partial [Pseudomonadota bacterium]